MPPLHTGIVLSDLLVVPLLDVHSELDGIPDGRQLTAELISEATGQAVGPDQVELLTAHPADIMLASPPTPTLVCHPADLRWYRGLRKAWVTDLDRSWRPVVCYSVGAIAWERVVTAGWWHLDGAEGVGRLSDAGGCRTRRG